MNKPSNPAILSITANKRPCKSTTTKGQAAAVGDVGTGSGISYTKITRARAETKSIAISRNLQAYLRLITLAFLLIKPMELWKKYVLELAS
jgi:hypothetical protein